MRDAARHQGPIPLTLSEPAPARGGADIAGVYGVDSDGRASFQAFVDEHRHLMSDYIARRMRGTPELCAEDALQEALIRMWQQWRHWPADPERREVYMRQALKVAAVDAIRARYGRNLKRPREYPVNFADLDRCIPSEPGAHAIVRELGLAIARESLERPPDKRDIERSVLVAAFAALTDFERRVLFMTARGDNGAQIASDLDVRHQLVRETLMRSRRLVRSLIEHADAGKVSPEEARHLWDLRDGNLSGRPKREAQRHLDHCTTCKRLAGIEDAVSSAGARVFLPLPMATALDAKGVAANGTAGAAGSSAPTGAGLAATGGGLLSGLTAKAAVALGILALGGSIAGTAKIYRERDRPMPGQRSALAASASVPRSRGAARPAAHAVKPTAAKTRSSSVRSHVRPAAGHSAPRPSPQATTPASVFAPAVAASPTASKATQQTSTPAGGEFVLGRP